MVPYHAPHQGPHCNGNSMRQHNPSFFGVLQSTRKAICLHDDYPPTSDLLNPDPLGFVVECHSMGTKSCLEVLSLAIFLAPMAYALYEQGMGHP